MAIAVEGDRALTRPLVALGEMGWMALAAAASLGAGAVHASAIGVHSEHRQAALTFTVLAVLQLGWGFLALVRPGRLLVAWGGAINLAALGGFALAKAKGISWVDGLEEAEAVQTADGLAAGLAVVAVVATAGHLSGRARSALQSVPWLTGTAALVVAAVSVPAMVSAGTHSHSSGHDDAAPAHHDAPAADAADARPASAVPPKPYHPDLPIDLGGVEGVTPRQQAAAENLLSATILALPQFADPEEIEAMGFVSIGDGALGHEHYLNPANMSDDRILDPSRPESLVFDTSVTPKKLVAAMYMMNQGDTLDDVPELGGALTQWHIHDNLCFTGPRVSGLTDANGECAPPSTKGPETPMIHVWVTPHPCGPFAALEGVAGGTVPEGEEPLCDHAHG
ncbi:MAG: hypothetical protein ACLGI8_13825 [Acidimicrobiia bacterium]|jgi:hypothetical protein